MPGIRLRPRAKADLVAIWEYIARDNEAQADAFIKTVDEKFRLLAQNPNIGRVRDELGASIHSLPVGRYVIFFRSRETYLEIVRVLHGARDVQAVFPAKA
jgi:toxin ParE1/3/4